MKTHPQSGWKHRNNTESAALFNNDIGVIPGNWHHSFLHSKERATISAGDVQGDWGCFPNEQKLALYYKDTARTVTQVIVWLKFVRGDDECHLDDSGFANTNLCNVRIHHRCYIDKKEKNVFCSAKYEFMMEIR